MPEERRQNLAETNRGSYYNQEKWLEKLLDVKVHFTMEVKVMMVIMMMRVMIKIWKQSFADVLQNRCSTSFCRTQPVAAPENKE